MMRPKWIAVGLALVGTAALAEAISPTDVVYGDYGQIDSSLTGTPGDAANGVNVMTTRSLGNCVACHAVSALSDAPFQGNVGPSLDGAADRWDEASLRGIVANAKMTFPETVMPAFFKAGPYTRPGDAFTGKAAPENGLPPLLTAQEVEDVVAYLLTLHEE